MCQLKSLFSVVVFSFMISNSLGISISSGLSSVISAVQNVTNSLANAKCEKNPTHLLCSLIADGHHNIQQHMPEAAILKPCSFLVATPHCCAQFCKPASGGTCDSDTGACFCKPSGRPNVCGLLISDESPLGEMNANDNAILNTCRDKCKKNTNGCTKPAAATDGIAGATCVCYCSDSTTTTATTAATTS